jgi:hypothetical protein
MMVNTTPQLMAQMDGGDGHTRWEVPILAWTDAGDPLVPGGRAYGHKLTSAQNLPEYVGIVDVSVRPGYSDQVTLLAEIRDLLQLVIVALKPGSPGR